MMGNNLARRSLVFFWLLLGLSALACLGGGNGDEADNGQEGPGEAGVTPGDPATATPDDADTDDGDEVLVTSPFAVRRQSSIVRAGEAGQSPLPLLTSTELIPFPPGSRVTTDLSGEAVLSLNLDDGEGCQDLYLYRESELLLGTCSAAEARSGNSLCALAGTAAINNRCLAEVVIETPGAEIRPAGTWLAVTYVPEMELTLVIVLDGAAAVRPVDDMVDRSLGLAIRVDDDHFIFVAPESELALAGLASRQMYPLRQLEPAIAALASLVGPRLDAWLASIRAQATEDQVLPTTWPEVIGEQSPADLSLLSFRGTTPLAADVQRALLTAVDWPMLRLELATEFALLDGADNQTVARLTASLQLPVLLDDLDLTYDPDVARALLEENGLGAGELSLGVVAPASDRFLAAVARGAGAYWEELGVTVTYLDDADRRASRLQRTVWLERQPVYLAVSAPDNADGLTQAILQAVDWQDLTAGIYALNRLTAFSSGDTFNLPDPDWPFSPARAAAIMAQSGYEDGLDGDLIVLVDEPRQAQAAALIQNHLAAVGLDLALIPLSPEAYIDYLAANETGPAVSLILFSELGRQRLLRVSR